MNFIVKLKIGRRLGLAFAIVLLLLSTVGGIGLIQASRIYDGIVSIADNWLPSVEALGNVRSAALDVRRVQLRQMLASGPDDARSVKAQKDVYLAAMRSSLQTYSKFVSSPEEQRISDKIDAGWARFLEIDAEVERLLAQGDAGLTNARKLIIGDANIQFNATMALVYDDIKLNHVGAIDELSTAAGSFSRARIWTIALTGIAFAMGIVIAVTITRSITTPLRRSVDIAETVARGDLTVAISVEGDDELSQLLSALENMNQALVGTVGRVSASSETIAIGSAEIAAGNTNLSQRTEEQAASLEQTAASMEELTAAVKQNAANALEGNALAAHASETATRGSEVVGRVIKTMNDISTSSSQVAHIISVIEAIAFQTNILALNAAVEAARAGEQGRGFAVVASEVRTLAQRSASAAKEIKELINRSVEDVKSGTVLVDDAGRTMTEVVQSVHRVATLMGEISVASGEQQTGIEQVNVAISQLDDVTQQNAALVEEASAAAQSMAAQSGALRELVSVFKIPVQQNELRSTASHSTLTQRSIGTGAPAAIVPASGKSIPTRDRVGEWTTF